MNDADFSFHFVDQSRSGSKTTTLIGDDTTTGSIQSLSGAAAALAVVRTAGGTIYVKGSSPALQSALGLSSVTALTVAGKWLSLEASDQPYQSVAAALDPQKEIDSFTPAQPFTESNPRRFHDRMVVGISGPVSGGTGATHTVTLYVPTEAPYTPVGATLTFGGGSSAGVEAVAFSHWGEQIHPSTPHPSVSFSSVSS